MTPERIALSPLRTVLACCKSFVVHQAPKSLSQPHTPHSFPSSSESGERHLGIDVFTSQSGFLPKQETLLSQSTSVSFSKLEVSLVDVESSRKDSRALCTLHTLPAM